MAVPDAVIDRMILKWEPPTPLEAHGVVWIGEDLEPIPAAIPASCGGASRAGTLTANGDL
jgi:hypothetical protein